MIIVLKIWVLLNMLFIAINLAHAAQITVTDDEQKTISIICRIAAKSPIINDEDTAGIAQFCIIWKSKIQTAVQELKPEEKKEQN